MSGNVFFKISNGDAVPGANGFENGAMVVTEPTVCVANVTKQV